MKPKRFFAFMLAGLTLTTAAASAPSASAAQTDYSVIDQAPPIPSITKFNTKEWDAGWYRMETDLQKGTSIYSFDYDPTMNEVKNENPEDYKIKELPDKFIGSDYIISRKNRRRELYFQAEQELDVYVAASKAYGASLELGWLSTWEKTADTMSTNDGTIYNIYKKTYPEGETVRLAAFGSDNDGGRNIFVMALPTKGEPVSRALTHNGLPAAGAPAEGTAADDQYQYYLNDVFNMEEGDGLPAGYTGFGLSASSTAGLSEKEQAKAPDSENYALNRPYTLSSTSREESPVDGNIDTYWQSVGVPSELTIDLEQTRLVDTVRLKLRDYWGDRTQNITLQASEDGRSFTTLLPATDYLFEKSKQNVLDLSIPETGMRYVKLIVASNDVQLDCAQLSEVEVYGPNKAAESWGTRHVEVRKENRQAEAAGFEKQLAEPATGRVVFEARVRSDRNNQDMTIPVLLDTDGRTAAALRFSSVGYIQAASAGQWLDVVPYTSDTWYTIKLVVDTETQTYDVWVDHLRKAQGVSFAEGAESLSAIRFSIAQGAAGVLSVDNLRLYDDTEVYLVEDTFNDLAENGRPAGWNFSDENAVSVAAVPFEEDKSLRLTTASADAPAWAKREINPLSGKITVEAKVKADAAGWTTVPAVTDSQGRVAAKVAMYRNSFYISNGDNWAYICNQELPHNYYPAGNWYLIKLTLDTNTNRYDFYVDGAKRYSGAAFAENVDALYYVQFTAEEENVLYVDNLKVYDSDSLARGLMPEDNIFNVKDYGAKGDGVTDDTDAIRAAIEDAAYTGGAVLLEDGVFYTGQITLYSDMTFFVDASATILAKMDRNVYKKVIPSRGYNANHQLGRGIIYCQDAENVRITGGGAINGNGFYAFNQNDPPNQRPCIMYLTLSRDMYVEHLNLIQSPFWTVVPYESENITVRGVNITNHVAPNRDGIDPVNCSNITIENCCVFAGDDALCPKSGNDIPSYNMDVRSCLFQSYCNAIKLGTDSVDAFKNYTFEDICIKNVGLSGIALESSDGSEIENLTFRRVDMNDVDNPMFAVVGNRYRTPSVPDAEKDQFKRLGYVRNITVENMNYTNPMEQPYSHKYEDVHEIMLIGLDPDKNTIQDGKEHRISNVLFKNVNLEMPGGATYTPAFSGGVGAAYPEHTGLGVSTGWAYTIRWADNVRFENCENVLLNPDVREEIARADYNRAKVSEPVRAMYALGLTDICAAVGTAEKDLGLPETVPVLLENNTVVGAKVAGWTADYDPAREGVYTFTAAIASSEEIDNTRQLTASVTVILEEADRTELEAAIREAEALRQSDYTADSWQKLADAVTAAKELPAAAGQTSIDAATTAIYDAMKGLRPAVDFVKGDLDKDGVVTIQDVMEACKILARRSAGMNPTEDEIARGDLDGVDGITISDVMEICKILARKA